VTPRSALPRDLRGMIVIVAIPMAAILVACLLQLAHVGDAVLQREQLQAAADAAAWHSALLHARGMNSAAMLNIVMALLLAVSTLVRAVEMLAVVGMVFYGTGDPLLTAASQADARLGDRIVSSVAMVSKLQAGLAAATPVLAAVTPQSEPHAPAGLAFSYALVPSARDAELEVDPARPWLLRARSAPQPAPRLAARLEQGAELASLALERDDFAPLCAEASRRGGQNLRALVGDVTRDRHLAELARQLADRLKAPLAEHLIKALCEPARAQPSSCAFAPVRSDAPAAKGCNEALAQLPPGSWAGAPALAPARVWSAAENGNVMLQTWGIALRSAARPTLGSEPALAQAEYYFACPADRPQWSQCADSAAWSLGWTARLRRLWRPDGETQPSYATSRAFLSSAGSLRRGLNQLSVSPVRDPERYLSAFFATRRDAAADFIH
jgi:hypothetical protein